jgi:Asp-tRNA(Asn)/Glu-tRNA(Gln) amidotransferase A subunit family amidase
MDQQGFDAIVYPTLTLPPAPIAGASSTNNNGNNTNLASYVGMASISVPAGFTSAGMPVGIDFMGRPFSEPTLLGLAYAFEQATHHRRPPASTPGLPGEIIPEPSSIALSLCAACGFVMLRAIVRKQYSRV